MKIRFFRLPKPKVYNYIPRYYDEQKEDLEERINNIKQEMGVSESNENYTPRIKGQMRSQYERNIKVKQRSSFRLVIILIALILLAYWLLFK